ncbi:hypothetical protein LDENG_00242530 [Lucifuga dentata]|nr:hypothetical protein LDENG_00242530 [Lucifuga dentata]
MWKVVHGREVEEELEVVWQAANRENQQMRETILDLRPSRELHGSAVSDGASPGWSSQAPDDISTSSQHQSHRAGSLLITSHQSLPSTYPGIQKRTTFESDSEHQNNSMDERQKYGLDFFC